MATAITYAKMSKAVYAAAPTCDGWTRIGLKSSGAGLRDAFQGAAFACGREVVVAFKGTSLTLSGDLVSDLKLGLGMNTVHYALAAQFIGTLPIQPGSKVSLCGHSLGGAIAQVVGNRTRLPFVTFNAPGVGLFSRNLGETATTILTGTAKIRAIGTAVSALRHPVQAWQDTAAVFNKAVGANLRLSGDVVSMIGVHFGCVIEIPVPDSLWSPLKLHEIDNVCTCLERCPKYCDKPLEHLVA